MNKFFSNFWVRLVSWLLVAIGSVALIIGGATAETIGSGVALVAGIVSAVGALIAFISERLKN